MKKVTITYLCEGARLMLGFGSGMFIRQVRRSLTADMSKPKQFGYMLGSCCVGWAIGHAIDDYVDHRLKVSLGVLNPDGTPSDALIEEFR